jgi:hypothetical protein
MSGNSCVDFGVLNVKNVQEAGMIRLRVIGEVLQKALMSLVHSFINIRM